MGNSDLARECPSLVISMFEDDPDSVEFENWGTWSTATGSITITGFTPGVVQKADTTVNGGLLEAPRAQIAKPPRIYWAELARLFMSPRKFALVWEPQIADFYEEYYVHLKRGDERQARIAVVRCNLLAIPKWVWMLALTMKLHIMDWARPLLGG